MTVTQTCAQVSLPASDAALDRLRTAATDLTATQRARFDATVAELLDSLTRTIPTQRKAH